jgi:hypothetical protein
MAKRGRPTKYKPEYCQKLVKFFSKRLYKRVLIKKGVKEKGTKDEYKIIPNDLPFFSEFEIKNGLGIGRLSKWFKAKNKDGEYKYPEFRQAYKKAKELQKIFLINNALMGNYNPTFAIFTAKNITDMKNTDNLDLTGDFIIQWKK